MLMVSSTAFGKSLTRKIEVIYNSVNLTVNGKRVNADNILYKGTTYVPLREVAEMLGKDVTWDQGTNTAGIVEKGTAPKPDTNNGSKDPSKVKISQLPLDLSTKVGDRFGTVYVHGKFKNNTNFPIVDYSTSIISKDKNLRSHLSTSKRVLPGETSPEFKAFGPKTNTLKDVELVKTTIRMDIGNGKHGRLIYDHKLNTYNYQEFNKN